MNILKTANNTQQIAAICKILTNPSESTLIVTDNINTKYQLIQRLNLAAHLTQLEKEVAKFADVIELFKEVNHKNVINILQNQFLKPELRINELTINDNPIFSLEKYPNLQNAIETTKTAADFNQVIDIWLDCEKPQFNNYLNDILENRKHFFENLYSQFFDEKIYICQLSEIPNKVFKTLIIADGNSPVYNKVVPYIHESNIDILPTVDIEANRFFWLASNILQAKDVFLIENLAQKSISYLLLYYKNSKNINTNPTPTPYLQPSNLLGKGSLTATLTPRSIEKLVINPFYFYLEYILHLKEAKNIRTKIFNYDIENAISHIIQKNNIDYYHNLTICDKYKMIKNIKNAVKILKCQCNLNQKNAQDSNLKNFTFKNIEILINPAFILSNEPYFYTKASGAKIKSGLDIIALVTANFLPNAIFLNYKKNGSIASLGVDKKEQISELIDHYQSKGEYRNTGNSDGFNKNYQHLARTLLIKN